MYVYYNEDSILCLGVFLDINLIPKDAIYLEVVPTEPTYSWYIEDGQVKVDPQKVIEYTRTQMPTLSKREFRGKLRDNNLFDQVDAYIKSSGNGYLLDAWEYADFFSRLDPFIEQAIIALGLNDEFVDSIWVSE